METKYNYFLIRNSVWKCHLQNDSHIISVRTCKQKRPFNVFPVCGLSLSYCLHIMGTLRPTQNSNLFADNCYFLVWKLVMVTSSNESNFRVNGPLCGEFTDHRWIPLTKANDAELWCFPWSAPEPTVEQTMETLVIWDTTALIMTSLQCVFCFQFQWHISSRVQLTIKHHCFR